MCNHHDFLYPQLIDGDNETAHGRVESGDDQSSGILDNLGITVLQSERSREQFGQSGVESTANFLSGYLSVMYFS